MRINPRLNLSVSIYRTRDRQWRWRIRSRSNLKILAASSESYRARTACANNLATVTGMLLLPPKGLRRERFTWTIDTWVSRPFDIQRWP